MEWLTLPTETAAAGYLSHVHTEQGLHNALLFIKQDGSTVLAFNITGPERRYLAPVLEDTHVVTVKSYVCVATSDLRPWNDVQADGCIIETFAHPANEFRAFYQHVDRLEPLVVPHFKQVGARAYAHLAASLTHHDWYLLGGVKYHLTASVADMNHVLRTTPGTRATCEHIREGQTGDPEAYLDQRTMVREPVALRAETHYVLDIPPQNPKEES